MAYSSTQTLLPIEEWCRLMSVPGWHFNQVSHPGRQTRGASDIYWVQNGYSGDPNRVVGRDEVAQAINEAESQWANAARFWPAPRWFCGDRERTIKWPDPSRGTWLTAPILRTHWGYLWDAGVEAWDQLNNYGVAVDYSDEDGDTFLDTATIDFGFYLDDVEDPCEVAIVPHGYDVSYEIKPLQVSVDGGVLTVTGPRWLFVNPARWLTTDILPMDVDAHFLDLVDIWRHYHAPYPAAVIRWLQDPMEVTNPNAARTQDACISVLRERTGQFAIWPSSYNAVTGNWTRNDYAHFESPHDVQLWYRAGYRDPTCATCDYMGPLVKRAIVSLANCYLADMPCGGPVALERWTRDREIQKMTTYNVAMANSHFGTTARGAVFAYSVLSRIQPLGKGG